MLIQPIPVSPWQANCYVVLADEKATQCVIVDPGITAAGPVARYVEERGVTPVALLATHGHLDHVGDAHLLAARWEIPLHIAAADRHLLERPGDGLGPQGTALMRQLTGTATLPPVVDVRDLTGDIELAGLHVSPFSAPGHTPGSTLLDVTAADTRVVFTGDVIFAGTIGRTDLPGGSMTEMRRSLRSIVERFPADVVLLPGHGRPTTLAEELDTNSYLR